MISQYEFPVEQYTKTSEYEWRILSYRPPYCWDFLQGFLSKRLIPSLEWISDQAYGRTFTYNDDQGNTLQGHFEATHLPQKNAFKVKLCANQHLNILQVVKNIRRILDLDTDVTLIEQQLSRLSGLSGKLLTGLRLPGIWEPFEVGIRAILGMQISVEAARKLVTQVVETYGEPLADHHLFPGPQILAGLILRH